jgi:hypothetical protein
MPEDPNLPTETEEVKENTQTTPEPQPTTPPVDYEKKFAESTRENQLLQAKLAEQEKARQDLTKEPTDSELRAAFPEWETLSEFEKRMAREALAAKRMAATANTSVKQMQEDRAWSTSIELALSSDQALQGKEQEFRQFASKPQYRNVPMDVLTAAFLQKAGAAPQPPAPTPRPGLETGTGGPKTPDRPKLLSADELRTLRKTDEKAYIVYIKAHPDALDADL